MFPRHPLLPAFFAFAAGIILTRLADFSVREIFMALGAYACMAAVSRLRAYSRLFHVNVIAATLCAGILIGIWRRPGPPPEIDFEPGEMMLLAGCVVEPPALFPDREQFVLELAPDARVRVQLYLKEGEPAPRLRYGQLVELDARLRNPRNYRNPGAFDYQGYLARRHIFWTASARDAAAIRITGDGCGSGFLASLFSFRQATLDRLDRLFSSDPQALGLLRAILAGDSSRLEKLWIDNYRRTGTYHALVISGLHVTTLAACFLFFFRILRASPAISLCLTTALAWIYALLVGAGTPVLRAAAGLTLFTIARFFHRRPSILNMLAAIAIAFLIIDPGQLFEPSFQLSFLAVALIGGIAIPFLETSTLPYSRSLSALDNVAFDPYMEPRQASFRLELRLLAETMQLLLRLPYLWVLRLIAFSGRMVSFCWELAVVSGVVQIGLTLPMIVYFHRFSLAGLTANLLIVPLTGIIVPVGFLAMLSGWTPLLQVTGLLADWSGRVAQWHADRDPSWRVPDPPAWLGSLFLLCVMLVTASFMGRRYRLLSAACLGSALAALILHPFAQQVQPGSLELTAIDVGQGDSLFIASPEGRLMLLDTGGTLNFGRKSASNFDTGEDVVSPYLWSRSIKRLDVLALTHAHEDHTGGAIALLENFRPRQLWTGALALTPSSEAIRKKARALGVEVIAPVAGERISWGGALIEILSPSPAFVPAARTQNNESLVMRLRHGSTSFLLTGDIERQVEARLISEGLLSRTDVLKVAHHGSKSSTTEAFMETVRPAFALVSSGEGNIFRHPHPEVISRLARHNSSIWRTDMHGLLTVISDGRRIRLATHSWPVRVPAAFAPYSAF
jgi:competence protein ComEC